MSESVWEEWLHPHRTGHCVREGGREGVCVCGGGGGKSGSIHTAQAIV